MKVELESCDLSLADRIDGLVDRSRGRNRADVVAANHGRCSLDTDSELPAGDTLSAPQRAARGAVGLAFHALGLVLGRRRALVPLAAGAHWFGASHVVASVTGYPGCPELGAIPSLVLRWPLKTECGPWEWTDARLGLAANAGRGDAKVDLRSGARATRDQSAPGGPIGSLR